ncbi:hypothetical protein WJX74_001660 [Apatococcus lobatus]|uniref:Uncharacterized protein n=1 Tax=Apatococcus lobatus TaxID=904363 RepID=A0AAW1QMR9_9CHLO
MDEPAPYRWIDTTAEPSTSTYRRKSQQRDSFSTQALNARAASLQLPRPGQLQDSTGISSHYWPAQTSLQPEALSYRMQHGAVPQQRASISHSPAYSSFTAGNAYQASPAVHTAYAPAFSSAASAAPQGAYQHARASSFYQPTNALALTPSTAAAASVDLQRAGSAGSGAQQSSFYQPTNALALTPSTAAAAPVDLQRAGSTGGRAQPIISSEAAPAPPNGYHTSSQDQVLSQLMQGLTHLTNEVSALKATRASMDYRASIDSTAGWNMASFDKGPAQASGSAPLLRAASPAALPRQATSSAQPGPSVPTINPPQSPPSLLDSSNSMEAPSGGGLRSRSVPGFAQGFQRPNAPRRGVRQSVDLGAAARPPHHASVPMRASVDTSSRVMPGSIARISEGNEDIMGTREMSMDNARKSQGDARSMADYLAQANANLEGRVEELFKMMQEIMSSEQGITDLELLSVIRSLREENVRLLKERQQVLEHNMQLLSRNSQLVEENASVLSRMVGLHQRQMQASTSKAGPQPAAAPAGKPASNISAKPAKRGVFGKLLGRSKPVPTSLPSVAETAVQPGEAGVQDAENARGLREVAEAMAKINADNREIMQLNQQLQSGMERMRTENLELTNRLTEAAMRASEAEAAHQQDAARAKQAATLHDDPLLNSSGSRPSSPLANGKVRRRGSSQSMQSPLATSLSRNSTSSARALELSSPARSLKHMPQTPFREEEPLHPGSHNPLRKDEPLDAVSMPPDRFMEASGAAADTKGPGSALPQVQPEAVPVLEESRSVLGPATPTRSAPQLPQVTPVRTGSPTEQPTQAAQLDALREQGFRDHSHSNGFAHAMDHGSSGVVEGRSSPHLQSIQSIPEEQPLQVQARSPSIESEFPPTPGSQASTGFNTAQALIEAGGESPEVFQKKMNAQHVLSDLLDDVRDSRLRRESGRIYKSASFSDFDATQAALERS